MRWNWARLVALGVFATSSILLANSSNASEWMYKKEDKAFGETQATAMAIGDASVVFVQCSNGELSLNLATPEDWKDDSEAMNLMVPKIIMATDGSEPIRYDVVLGENGLHKLLAKVEDAGSSREAAAKIVEAKKKLEIGIEVGGKRFHASKISAAGASKKIQSVLDECGSKQKAESKPDEKK